MLETARGHLVSGRYSEAAATYRSILESDSSVPAAHEGLVRALFSLQRNREAFETIDAALKTVPDTPEGWTLASIAAQRRGDFESAEANLRQALKQKPSHAFALHRLARLFALLSRFESANKVARLAYRSAPDDPEAGIGFGNPAGLTQDRNAHMREGTLAQYDPSSGQTGDRAIRKLISDYKHYAFTLIPTGVARDSSYGVKVQINGQEIMLMLDTGTTGLFLHQKGAVTAGLELLPGTSRVRGGVGDQKGPNTKEWLARQVAIGDLRFENVRITSYDKKMAGTEDGIIGTDFFEQFLLTMDFPKLQMKLDPYPGLTSAPVPVSTDASEVTPKGFHPFLRWGHQILIPTAINGKKTRRFFLIDTGANVNFLDMKTAKEDAYAIRDGRSEIRGFNGLVSDVYRVPQATLDFAGVRQQNLDLVAIEMNNDEGRYTGVDLGGFIGVSAFSQLRMTLNYRDACIRFEKSRR